MKTDYRIKGVPLTSNDILILCDMARNAHRRNGGSQFCITKPSDYKLVVKRFCLYYLSENLPISTDFGVRPEMFRKELFNAVLTKISGY